VDQDPLNFFDIRADGVSDRGFPDDLPVGFGANADQF